ARTKLRTRADSGVANLLGHGNPNGDEDQEDDDLLHRISRVFPSPRRLGAHRSPPVTAWQPPVLFEERLRPSRRAWWWLAVISVITFFTLGLIVVPIALIAWFINIARYRSAVVRIDTERVWVGRRSLRLTTLDLSKIGRATNPWPWRAFSNRYLGGNPIW